MLGITRKRCQELRIGDDIKIIVVRTKGKAVRLGVEAPAHVRVLRGEIRKRVASPKPQRGPS